MTTPSTWLRSRHATTDPSAAAGLCMTVVLPHFRALAAEIERLREEIAAVRAHALLNGSRLADLERIRREARAGKSSSKGEQP
jgi:hypothetical protein